MIKKRKLAGVIHELTMGGAERMMVNILNYFASNKDEVHLIVFNNRGTLKALLDTSITVHDLGGLSVKRGIPQCLKEIYQIRPDTLFSGIGHLNIAIAPFIPIMRRLLPQTEWVARETNIVSLQNQEEKHPKFFDYLYSKSYKNFDVIIAQSEDMREDLAKNYGLDSSKVVLINNPIDIESVQKLGKESIEYDFKREPQHCLVSVGTLRHKKRHDLLLEAFALLPQNYRLIVVGSGAEEAKLKTLSRALEIEERVDFEGDQTNPYPYMKNAELSLLTSEHEGFPNVLLEANSLGTPVVAFACKGGISEIIEEGINGFSVKNGDVKAFSHAIIEAISFGFKDSLVINSVQRRYSKEIIMRRYEEVFYGK